MVRRRDANFAPLRLVPLVLSLSWPPSRPLGADVPSLSAPSPANHFARYFISTSTRVYSTTYVYPNAGYAGTLFICTGGNARSTVPPPAPRERVTWTAENSELCWCFASVLILHFARVVWLFATRDNRGQRRSA